jgi:hypothetical protein
MEVVHSEYFLAQGRAEEGWEDFFYALDGPSGR